MTRMKQYKKSIIKKRHSNWQLLIMLLILLFVCACTSSRKVNDIHSGPCAYLLNEEKGIIEPVILRPESVINIENTSEIINYILDMLKNGASSSNFAPTIPKEISLRYSTYEDNNVILNFSSEYNDLNSIVEIHLRSSIVRSLTSFDKIKSVEFFVEGIPLKLNSNRAIGRMYEEEVYLSYAEGNFSSEDKIVTLYYPNEAKNLLVFEQRAIEANPNKKIEELVVEQLLKESKVDIFPKGTELLNIYTHEGVCYVDLNKVFKTGYLPDGINEKIAIYTIVNSLTELSNVTNIQFLIEGEIVKTYHGTLSMNRLFAKNYSLIEY